MNTNNTISQFKNGLNIHVVSFSLPKQIIKEKDQIRVSITTIPDGCKQKFLIKSKLMEYANHLFSLNISEKTKKIVMVFRKKTLMDKQMIASTVINLNDFKEMPKEQITNGMINTEVRTINLYYPIQKQQKEEHQKKVERVIIGSMKVILSFRQPFSSIDKENIKNNNNNKCQKKRKNSKKVAEYNDFADSEEAIEAPMI